MTLCTIFDYSDSSTCHLLLGDVHGWRQRGNHRQSHSRPSWRRALCECYGAFFDEGDTCSPQTPRCNPPLDCSRRQQSRGGSSCRSMSTPTPTSRSHWINSIAGTMWSFYSRQSFCSWRLDRVCARLWLQQWWHSNWPASDNSRGLFRWSRWTLLKGSKSRSILQLVRHSSWSPNDSFSTYLSVVCFCFNFCWFLSCSPRGLLLYQGVFFASLLRIKLYHGFIVCSFILIRIVYAYQCVRIGNNASYQSHPLAVENKISRKTVWLNTVDVIPSQLVCSS